MKTHLLTAVFYLSWLGFSSGKQISITVCKSWTKFKQVLIFRILDSSHAAAAAKLLQSCPNSLWPHRWQPTRLPCPWDSPGKNTGVGCHFFLQCMKVKSESEVAQLCLTLRDPMYRSLPGSSVHGIFQARVLEWGAIAFSSMDMSLGKLQELVLDREA